MAITISGENNNDRILASDGVIDQISGINIVGVLTATSFTGDLTGDVTGNLTGNVTGNINNTTLLLQTGGTERLRIDQYGRVMIGTTTVGDAGADNFNVATTGQTGITIRSGTSSGGQIYFADGTSGDDRYRGIISYQHGSNYMRFYTNAVERLRIASDGKVGINQSSPTAMLEVVDSAYHQAYMKGSSTVAGIRFGNSSHTNGYIYYDNGPNMLFNVAGAEKARITSDGFVGINKTDPKTGLTINKYGTQPVVNGNTYPYPAGNWSTVWNTGTANSTDYWCGFVGSYNVSSATVNISLSPNTFNFSTQQGIYIAGEATTTSSADFTVGKIIGGSQTGASASAGNQRATKSEMFRIDSSGHIGIGTDNPSNSLQGAWNKVLVISADTSNGSMIRFTESSSAAGGSNTGLLVGQHSNNSYIVNYQNGFMSLRTNNTERFRIGDSGQLGIGGATYGSSGQALVSQGSGSAPQWATVASGGASNISFNSGYGIDFSADSHNSGMTSELLDDYEEGTWSAGINIGTATINQTNYVKIGRFVNATCFCAQMSPRNSSSGIQITGLPYAANGTYTAPIGLHRVIGDQGNGYFAYVSSGTTTIDILQNPWSQQGWKSLAHNQIQHASAAYIIIAVSYQTS